MMRTLSTRSFIRLTERSSVDLAAARGADEGRHLAARHVKRDGEEGLFGAVPEREVADTEDGILLGELPVRARRYGLAARDLRQQRLVGKP